MSITHTHCRLLLYSKGMLSYETPSCCRLLLVWHIIIVGKLAFNRILSELCSYTPRIIIILHTFSYEDLLIKKLTLVFQSLYFINGIYIYSHSLLLRFYEIRADQCTAIIMVQNCVPFASVLQNTNFHGKGRSHRSCIKILYLAVKNRDPTRIQKIQFYFKNSKKDILRFSLFFCIWLLFQGQRAWGLKGHDKTFGRMKY